MLQKCKNESWKEKGNVLEANPTSFMRTRWVQKKEKEKKTRQYFRVLLSLQE